ncbi:MAG TPA: VWA domain-containing protein [Gemmataceae bacterium]|nr:VWA domain-containing protein [Gemmataceae bacterium]
MRIRHRIPSIFNLSMVDVLCCALGCVILIWLINLRESKQNQEEAKRREDEAGQLLASQRAKIDELIARLQVASAEADSLQARLRSRGKELDAAHAGAADLTSKLAEARGRIDALQAVADAVPGLRDDLKKTRDQYAADESRLQGLIKDLTAKTQEYNDAIRKLTAAQADAKQFAADLASLQAADAKLKLDSATDAARRAQDLADAAKKLTDLQATLDVSNREVIQLRSFKDKYAADEDKVLALTKDVNDARRNADALQADNVRWRNEAVRIKTEADNRFAGITLTGKRVVFLVDMSGSMDYVDDNTKAPEKWLGVRTAVVKIMRSLPDLEKFQLITFSDKSHYPLGKEGNWLDFDPKTSPDLVFKTLAAITPEGGTNMYVPMQSAFAMRPQGLDTIYLCSDGLPNLGEGVTAEEAKTLTEDERGAKLGAVIRKKLKADWNRDLSGQARVHIHTVGFFYESPDVGAFLWALARENDGGFVGMSKP